MRLISVSSCNDIGNDCDINEIGALVEDDGRYFVLKTTKYSAGGWGNPTSNDAKYSLDGCDDEKEAIKWFNDLMK